MILDTRTKAGATPANSALRPHDAKTMVDPPSVLPPACAAIGNRAARAARSLRELPCSHPLLVKGTPQPACASCCRSCGGLVDCGFQRLLEHVHFCTCAHICAPGPSLVNRGLSRIRTAPHHSRTVESAKLAGSPRVLINCPTMRRMVRWVKRLTAFRIGLATGLVFALLHLGEVGTRQPLPILGHLESALIDARFRQRGQVPHSGRVVIAAIDEAAIAKFGRFPWDRRVLARLVDRLDAEGAAAIAFDMSLSDEDLGAQFAGAKRFRKRFEEISLAAPASGAAVERFGNADANVAGAESALQALRAVLKPGGDAVYRVAKGRLEDGRRALADSRRQLDALVKEHAAYADELEREVTGFDPDRALAEAIRRASPRVALAFIAQTAPEMGAFQDAEVEENVRRVEASRIAPPEFRYRLSGGAEKPAPRARTWITEDPALRSPLQPIAAAARSFGFFNALPDADGAIRQAALAMRVRGRYLPSLDAVLVAAVLGIPPSRIVPVTADDGAAGRANLDGFDFGGKLFVPTDFRGLLQVNYAGGDGTFANYPVADVLENKLPPGALRGKAVLIGATAQGTFDQRVTPFMRITSGVETHANAVETMLSRRFLRRDVVVRGIEVLALVALAVAFAWIFARVRVRMALPAAFLAAAGVWVVVSALFLAGYQVVAALPLVEMGSTVVLVAR